MIVIVDYGIGNLRSMEKALSAVGAEACRTDDPDAVLKADKVVLPGVGAFGACAGEIRRRDGLEEAILAFTDSGKPFLGVCVGMQLLFDVGEEMGVHRGLGVIPGRVVRFDVAAAGHSQAALQGADPEEPSTETWSGTLKIPHMGWNTIHPRRDDPILNGLGKEAYFYFVHSFLCIPDLEEDVLASCRYGLEFAAVVRRNNIYGVQFHPEKSQQNGLQILKNFAELA